MHWNTAFILSAIWIGFLISFILSSTDENDSTAQVTSASVIFVISSLAFGWVAYKLTNMEPTVRKMVGMNTRRGRNTAREFIEGTDDDEE